MPDLVMTKLPVGATAVTYLSAKVEPYRQRGEAPPAGIAPLNTTVVPANGTLTVTGMTNGIWYAVWVAGNWKLGVIGSTKVAAIPPPAQYRRTDLASTFAAKGMEAGATGSAYPLRPGA